MNASIKPTVSVFGATGHYGRKIAARLTGNGNNVKALTRNINRARGILGDKIFLVEGSVEDRAKVHETLEGAQSVVVCLSGMDWKQVKKIEKIEVGGLTTIMYEAAGLNINRLVFISVFDIDRDFTEKQKSTSLADTKQASENMIRQSGFNWTILGCPPSHELFFRLLRKNTLTVPGGGYKKLVCISPDDVGEIAAQAALRSDLSGKRFRMAGPDIISFPEFAEKAAMIYGRKIKHRTIPLLIVNIVTGVLSVINPMPRMIYSAIKMMNAFPSEISGSANGDFKLLTETFNYTPTSIEDEIRKHISLQP
jgi:uncharacterized protein YbjT (DUF2867 family)